MVSHTWQLPAVFIPHQETVCILPGNSISSGLVDHILEELISLISCISFMYNFGNSLSHLYRMCALEDITSHINAARSFGDYCVSQLQSLFLRQLLTSGYHDGYRAGSNNFFKIITVIGLNQLYAHLSNDTGSQFEETISTLHL